MSVGYNLITMAAKYFAEYSDEDTFNGVLSTEVIRFDYPDHYK